MFPGPDMSKWPARYAEAVGEVAMRRRLRQNAELEADIKERNHGRD